METRKKESARLFNHARHACSGPCLTRMKAVGWGAGKNTCRLSGDHSVAERGESRAGAS